MMNLSKSSSKCKLPLKKIYTILFKKIQYIEEKKHVNHLCLPNQVDANKKPRQTCTRIALHIPSFGIKLCKTGSENNSWTDANHLRRRHTTHFPFVSGEQTWRHSSEHAALPPVPNSLTPVGSSTAAMLQGNIKVSERILAPTGGTVARFVSALRACNKGCICYDSQQIIMQRMSTKTAYLIHVPRQ